MTYQEAANLLKEQDHILILTHRRPDGDTIGCGAALCLGLRQMGKEAFLQENEEAHGLFAPYMEGLLAPSDFAPHFIVTVDTADWDLAPNSVHTLYEGRVDLCIDHHRSSTLYGKKNCIDPECAACGELIYQILNELTSITPEIARLLYLAISTDTGCFIFSNTTAKTHRITAALFEIGCDHQQINKLHFRTKTLKRLKIEGHLVETMTLLHGGKTAIAVIPRSLMEALGATEEDVDNIAAFLEQIEGVQNAATIRELEHGECKISLRSDGELNASDVCALLGGGGHRAAAGCSLFGSTDEAKAAIIRSIDTILGSEEHKG